MEPNLDPFRFFSRSFHKSLWSSVILPRLRDEKKAEHSVFENHVPMEFLLAAIICLMMLAVGMSRWIHEHSRLWAFLAVMGVGGIVYLLIQSIKSQSGEIFSFNSFCIPVFFFFIVLGMSTGLFVGFILKNLILGLFGLLAGGILGYLVGIFAGAVMMNIGWMGTFFILFSIPVSIGLIVVSMVMLIALIV